MAHAGAPRRSALGAAIAVLCLHGLTGSPDELAPLARGLDAAGHVTRTPMLAGHGTSVAALAATHWLDWYASAEAALLSLVAEGHRPVTVVGASAGGLLSARLAVRHPGTVNGLVLLATPLELSRMVTLQIRLRTLVPAALRPRGFAVIPKRGGVNVSDPALAEGLRSLPAYPLEALGELLKMMGDVRPLLPRVAQPVLLVHGDLDATVSRAQVEALAAALSGAKRLVRLDLPASAHLVAIDRDRERLADAVIRFLGSL